MFEQASIDTRGMLRSPWAMMASVAGQTLALGVVAVVSLIHTDALPRGFLMTNIAPPRGASKPADAPERSRAAQPIRTSPHALVFSTNVRKPVSDDAGPQLSTPDGIETGGAGVIGAMDATSGDTLLIGTAVRIPPTPPPAAMPEREKRATPALNKPILISSGVQAAKLIRQVKPTYPPLARQARISGTVRLVAIIGRDGAIRNLRVSSGHPLLVTAAVEAVKQWLYRPTLLNTEPVEVITQVDVNFTLSNQ